MEDFQKRKKFLGRVLQSKRPSFILHILCSHPSCNCFVNYFDLYTIFAHHFRSSLWNWIEKLQIYRIWRRICYGTLQQVVHCNALISIDLTNFIGPKLTLSLDTVLSKNLNYCWILFINTTTGIIYIEFQMTKLKKRKKVSSRNILFLDRCTSYYIR